MIVEGVYVFTAPPAVVFEALLDPGVIAKSMPGTKELVAVGPHEYRGKMMVGIGPVTAAEFDLRIVLTELAPPVGFLMSVDGTGRFGFTKGQARVSLEPDGTGTRMNYNADLQVGGKIAAVGQRLLDVVSRAMLRTGLEALGKEVEDRLRGVGGKA